MAFDLTTLQTNFALTTTDEKDFDLSSESDYGMQEDTKNNTTILPALKLVGANDERRLVICDRVKHDSTGEYVNRDLFSIPATEAKQIKGVLTPNARSSLVSYNLYTKTKAFTVNFHKELASAVLKHITTYSEVRPDVIEALAKLTGSVDGTLKLDLYAQFHMLLRLLSRQDKEVLTAFEASEKELKVKGKITGTEAEKSLYQIRKDYEKSLVETVLEMGDKLDSKVKTGRFDQDIWFGKNYTDLKFLPFELTYPDEDTKLDPMAYRIQSKVCKLFNPAYSLSMTLVDDVVDGTGNKVDAGTEVIIRGGNTSTLLEPLEKFMNEVMINRLVGKEGWVARRNSKIEEFKKNTGSKVLLNELLVPSIDIEIYNEVLAERAEPITVGFNAATMKSGMGRQYFQYQFKLLNS